MGGDAQLASGSPQGMSTGFVWGNFLGGYFSRRNVQGKLPGGKCLGKERNVQIPMKDYKHLHVVVMICATLVNTQTDRHTDTQQYDWL